MSTYTTNYNLEKPDSTDDFKDFRSNYNSNMDIIDANLGGGGGGNVDDVLVNGVSVVDGNHDAQITSYKEVTQAEYNALPSSKLTDGIAYFIKDIDNASVEGYPPLIYSLEEREVGVWTDGKPVYKRTFYLATASLSSKEFSISTGLSDIEKILACTGVLTNGSETYMLPFERLTERESIRTFARVNSDGTVTLNVITGVGGASVYTDVTDIFVTIYYTKTTDTAGSGIWNGQGGLAHHYSTNETVIGTWIDGKPLYEKTVEFGALPNNATKDVLHNVANVNLMVKCDGIAYNSSYEVITVPYANVDSYTYQLQFYADRTKVSIKTKINFTDYTGIITIRYTKTTD